MSLKRKFAISSILMFTVPVLLIALVTAVVFGISLFRQSAFLNTLAQIDKTIPDEALQPGGMLFAPVIIWGLISTAIVAATCAVVVLSLSRVILSPLKALKQAAENIRDGNLEFDVMRSDFREINELCLVVDELRMRLKRNVADQMAYEKERNRLLANISHDLRTPITSIKGYVEGIRDGIAGSPEMVDKYLETIYLKAGALERLVEQMSDFSELELGRMRFHFETVGAVGFLRKVAEENRVDIESADAAFETDLPDGELAVRMDAEKLRRVFLNLFGNALKYRAQRPLVVGLSAEIADRGIHITVRDNGCGIPKDELNKVFEGFYRGDPARSGSAKGHGLGLSISKQIIENHRGKIWMKSEEGVGTEVHLYLPAAGDGGLT